MTIFYRSLLITAIFTFYACNTNSSTDNQANNQPLSAVSMPDTIAPIDFSFETIVLEADLPSPRKEMSGQIKGLTVKVNYGSPSVKGREIWDELVPFDKVWRTGANEATTFTIDEDIIVNEQILDAGTYSLFILPTSDSWQMIFNNTTDQWGAYEYDASKDALRIPVSPKTTSELSEMLEFIIDGNQIVLLWENLRIPFAVGPSDSSKS